MAALGISSFDELWTRRRQRLVAGASGLAGGTPVSGYSKQVVMNTSPLPLLA